jgi:hypothetical protein
VRIDNQQTLQAESENSQKVWRGYLNSVQNGQSRQDIAEGIVTDRRTIDVEIPELWHLQQTLGIYRLTLEPSFSDCHSEVTYDLFDGILFELIGLNDLDILDCCPISGCIWSD